MLLRAAKSWGPDAPTLASSLWRRIGPTGFLMCHIRRRRWQKSPVTGESTKETVKTIACGNAGCSGATVVTTRVLSTLAHEAAGATGTRHSPRPLFSGRMIQAQLGRIAPRDRGGVFDKHERAILSYVIARLDQN